MWSSRRSWVRVLGAAALGVAGCTPEVAYVLSPQPSQPGVAAQPPAQTVIVPPSARASRVVADGPLSLEQLLDLATKNHPEAAAARARAGVAQGRMIQAGLYPNPVVTVVLDELGRRAGAAGNPGLLVAQEIVTADKLRLARAAAAHGVSAADWQAVTRVYDVRTRARSAFYEALAARREVGALEDAVRIAEDGLSVAERVQKAGIGTRPDVLRARVDLDQNRVRLQVAHQRRRTADQLLAVAVGVPALPEGEVSGSLDTEPPDYAWQPALAHVLTRSSEVQEAQALVLQAEGTLQFAVAVRKPNVLLAVRPSYSFPDRDARVLVEVGAALPLYNRNQGNIAAAAADVLRTQEDARLVELRLTARLSAAFQRYHNARAQAAAYVRTILPNARESLRLVRLGYESGDLKYDYTAVLEAQRTLVQARLGQVLALGELWQAVSEIEGLLQLPSGADSCR